MAVAFSKCLGFPYAIAYAAALATAPGQYSIHIDQGAVDQMAVALLRFPLCYSNFHNKGTCTLPFPLPICKRFLIHIIKGTYIQYTDLGYLYKNFQKIPVI
jgi:hypothetical protein